MSEKKETGQLNLNPNEFLVDVSTLTEERKKEFEVELQALVDKYSTENEEKRKVCQDIIEFIKTLKEENNLITAVFEHDIDYRYEDEYPVKKEDKVKSRLVIEYWSPSHATS